MTPHATTAQQFFERFVTAKLADPSGPFKDLAGRYQFEVEGDGGGTWLLDCDQRTVAHSGAGVRCVVRARERDFMALVEGRMSVEDGLLTERLHLAGEAGALVALMDAVRAVRERRDA